MANRPVYLFLEVRFIKTLFLRAQLFKKIAAVFFGLALSNTAIAVERVEVIKTDIDRTEASFDRIDTENFEISFPSVGLLAIEDFEAALIYNIRAAYHLNEHLFFEASYGMSEGDETSYEEISPGTSLVSDDDREYKTWDVSLGVNIFPGETWFFGRAYSSDFYTVFGAGQTDFGDRRWSTLNVGAGYRLFINDWLAARIDVRDHIFKRDIFGEDSLTHNIEMSFALSYFF